MQNNGNRIRKVIKDLEKSMCKRDIGKHRLMGFKPPPPSLFPIRDTIRYYSQVLAIQTYLFLLCIKCALPQATPMHVVGLIILIYCTFTRYLKNGKSALKFQSTSDFKFNFLQLLFYANIPYFTLKALKLQKIDFWNN